MTPARDRSRERMATRSGEIRRAVADDELTLHYQPIVALGSGRVRGVEALLRWQHPVGGLLGPDDFLPDLLRSPVISDITRWVLRTACRDATQWPQWTVSVNVTAQDVLRPDFVDDVVHALATASLPAERLVLELTETALVQDLPLAADALGRLRGLGVGIALDDFGTGYSSMLYLRDLPVTTIKIDRAFVQGVDDGGDNHAIVSSLLTLARAVGMTSVAEGVETTCQARMLRSLGCVLGQGYLWSPPLPAPQVRAISTRVVPPPSAVAPKAPLAVAADPRLRLATDLLLQGASLHTIAAALNSNGHRTDRGTRWNAPSVAHLLNEMTLPSEWAP